MSAGGFFSYPGQRRPSPLSHGEPFPPLVIASPLFLRHCERLSLCHCEHFHSVQYKLREGSPRFFAKSTLSDEPRFFAALRMTGSEGLRMTGRGNGLSCPWACPEPCRRARRRRMRYCEPQATHSRSFLWLQRPLLRFPLREGLRGTLVVAY